VFCPYYSLLSMLTLNLPPLSPSLPHRDRIAVLDKTRQILVRNFKNECLKVTTPPLAGIDGLFFAGTSGRLLMKSEDRVVLYDQQARKIIAELQVHYY
jgi:coatomer subunit alpha